MSFADLDAFPILMGAEIAGVRDQFPKLKLIGSIHISDPEEEFASSFLARAASKNIARLNTGVITLYAMAWNLVRSLEATLKENRWVTMT
jgi:hypothetical protein